MLIANLHPWASGLATVVLFVSALIIWRVLADRRRRLKAVPDKTGMDYVSEGTIGLAVKPPVGCPSQTEFKNTVPLQLSTPHYASDIKASITPIYRSIPEVLNFPVAASIGIHEATSAFQEIVEEIYDVPLPTYTTRPIEVPFQTNTLSSLTTVKGHFRKNGTFVPSHIRRTSTRLSWRSPRKK
jgi:hypothetical protein